MKKFNNHYPCYGQSVASRIAYYQKMGVAQGIMNGIKHSIRDINGNLDRWTETIELPKGTIKQCNLTVIIPTPSSEDHDLLEIPLFTCRGKVGFIDMLHISNELSFHIMLYDYIDHKRIITNGGWHTVREELSLEDTCTLFEYVGDRLQYLTALSPEDCTKYNGTGALGVNWEETKEKSPLAGKPELYF